MDKQPDIIISDDDNDSGNDVEEVFRFKERSYDNDTNFKIEFSESDFIDSNTSADNKLKTEIYDGGVIMGNNAKEAKEISGDGEALLNILLNNPEKMCMNTKPSGIHKDSLFTLNSKTIPIESVKADDNGPYEYKGTTTKFFYYENKENDIVLYYSYFNLI